MNDQVGRRTINVGWGYIRGFAHPRYAKDNSSQIVGTAKSIDELANEVLQGAWGNGDARKAALEQAGYNYGEIQKRVNVLVKTTKGSIDAIAREVIAGKWGNGQDRKNRLIQRSEERRVGKECRL